MKALIAGGGIGGLTAALCLAVRGIEVEVFERAESFREIGAGIQISPNASRVLHALGLEAALRALAFLPLATQFRDWASGEVISERPLGPQAFQRYGAPYYHLHRGDLIHILERAARDHARIRLHTGVQVQGCAGLGPQDSEVKSADAVGHSDGADRVRLFTLEHGRPRTHEGDLLIGADGIHSQIRADLFGQSQPRFTGNVAWRALVPADRLPAGLIRPMSTAWWGPGKHFVHYYVRGGALVNCVCVIEKQGWEIESWTERGALAELREDFAGWHDDLQQLIDQIDEQDLFKWALFDRDPMPTWSRGAITLLGDACHPTLPFMAQGAAMAIEDAAVLACCLSAPEETRLASNVNPEAWSSAVPDTHRTNDLPRPHGIPDRLIRYESLRRERTAGIQLGSRRNARTFHLAGAQALERNHAFKNGSDRSMDALYGYDAFQVHTNS